jgi:magnesium chelatase family protein
MLAKLTSGTTIGLSALPVSVEVDVASAGLPAFFIVGLADKSVEEARERVRSALRNSGFDFPARRLTVNLAPADLPKEKPMFDLAIAIGLAIASGQIEADISQTLMIGELSLDGSLRYTQGVLPLVMLARTQGFKSVFIPKANVFEAQVVDGVDVYAFESLSQVCSHLRGEEVQTKEAVVEIPESQTKATEVDFSQIKGQEQAKRALEIAASGGHNVLLNGVPGSGKTLLARSFPSILPPLSADEVLELTQIYSITGNLSDQNSFITQRPFRSPHHTASYVGIIGGGNKIKPGEVSLAHRGVLFLDELPEFPRQVLEALRQPLEDKKVVVSRAAGSISFPAQFILLAAQNPCPCGFYLSGIKDCVCMPSQVARYKKKVSGPLLDRIDLHLHVPAVDVEKLAGESTPESSEKVRVRVIKAREIQSRRFKGSGIYTNAEMNNQLIKKYCQLDQPTTELLKQAVIKLKLSARSYFRILRLSRTIADLAGRESIELEDVAEALQYRAKEE